jgi:hypothetical protein
MACYRKDDVATAKATIATAMLPVKRQERYSESKKMVTTAKTNDCTVEKPATAVIPATAVT